MYQSITRDLNLYARANAGRYRYFNNSTRSSHVTSHHAPPIVIVQARIVKMAAPALSAVVIGF
jgi:hypothetical protein